MGEEPDDDHGIERARKGREGEGRGGDVFFFSGA